MQNTNIMDEDNSMYEKIILDIKNIIYNDLSITEFCIVPIHENKNKSPVLYEEHNLGLESWCVKYVYTYIYKELFKVRRLLRKNRLIQEKCDQVNNYLISALLIHPEVVLFWNMRRELIEHGSINLDFELLLTRLVLSNKSKSNEAFAYRKWIVSKLFKSIAKDHLPSGLTILLNELSLTQMAMEKSPHNYHALTHRIWSLESLFAKHNGDVNLEIVLAELKVNADWSGNHVSEHTGFHFRQYLCKAILRNSNVSLSHDIESRILATPYVNIRECKDFMYLNQLLGKTSASKPSPQHKVRYFNYVNYITTLLSDLFLFIDNLNITFPGHETLWYHRRFIIFHLLKVAYEYHDLTWIRNTVCNELFTLHSDDNIINSDTNGETYPKLPKYEVNAVESSHLYKILVKFEFEFIKENSSSKCSNVQRELAKRHEKWLKFILCFNKD